MPERCGRCSSATTTAPGRSARATAARWPSCAATPCWRCSGARVAHEDDAAARAAGGGGARARGAALASGRRARCGVSTGDVVAPAPAAPRRVIGDAVADAERLARAADGGEIRVDRGDLAPRAPRRAASRAARRRLRARRPRPGRPGDRAPARPSADRARGGARRACATSFARVVAERTPRLMTIVGEPGIGKSRLVAELARDRRRRGDGAHRPLPGRTATASRTGRCARSSCRRPASARSTSWRRRSARAGRRARRAPRLGPRRATAARTPAGRSCG